MSDESPGSTDEPFVDVDAVPPFCFGCGYDLTGLELPHCCPECGRYGDPSHDAREAKQWFARCRSGLLWWIRPSKVPLGLFYSLHDPTSARIAARRRFRWLWLPAMMTSLVVFIGSFVAVEYDVAVWYYDKADPAKTPHADSTGSAIAYLTPVSTTARERLFSFSFLRRGQHVWLGAPDGTVWMQVREQTRTGLVLTAPSNFGALRLNLDWGSLAWFTLVFGYLPTRSAIALFARRAGRLTGRVRARTAVATCLALVAPVLGAALWVWCVTVLAVGILLVFIPEEFLFGWLRGFFLVTAGLWIAGAIVGWPLVISLDRARLIFPARAWMSLLLVVVTIVGPPVGYWLLLF